MSYEKGEYIRSPHNDIKHLSIGKILNSNGGLSNLSVFQISSFNEDGGNYEWYFGEDSYSYHILVNYNDIVQNVVTASDILNLIKNKDSDKLVKLIR